MQKCGRGFLYPCLKFKRLQLKEKYEAFVTKINYCFFDEYIRKFIKANADRYNFITEEAVQFVQKYREKYAIEDMMVSFSGGKDSTVTSHIVNRALGTNKVLHIFGDTTLEFPYTLEYKKRFKKNEESRGVRVLTAKNREKNFEDLCDIVGPPSRVMRWCCTVFKTGAIQKTISSAFKDKNNILSFQGIRHSESVSRSKYERESESPKISKQTVASPIIDWIDYDVWLYILTTGIDFNEAYRLGWTRVGCWCCPNNGGWSEFLAKVHMYDQYIHWHEEFATTWFMYFNRCDAEELEKSEVVTILSREIKKYVNGGSFSEKSLSNDVDVLLNMYSRNKEKLNPEDKNISPFSHLALIKKLDGKYVKCHPSKRIFPEEVVLYELSLRLIGNEGISIEEVLFGEKGIVKIYNLSSVMANDYLDRLDTAGYIRVDRTAGLDMIYPVRELNPRNIIEDFYENN